MSRLTVRSSEARQRSKTSAVEQLTHAFAESVSQLPQAREVSITGQEDIPRLWTVIDATPFDPSPRYEVYRCELAVRERFPRVVVEFALINPLEWPFSERAFLIPSTAIVVWRRP
jgi:hypothetical protein